MGGAREGGESDRRSRADTRRHPGAPLAVVRWAGGTGASALRASLHGTANGEIPRRARDDPGSSCLPRATDHRTAAPPHHRTGPPLTSPLLVPVQPLPFDKAADLVS